MLYRGHVERQLSLSGLFHVNNFSGDLAGAITVQDFECLDPTAALPAHKNASYEATVTEVNAAGGYVEYYVRVTPPGATDGVTRPDGEHLSGYQHVGGKVRVYRAFTGSLEFDKKFCESNDHKRKWLLFLKRSCLWTLSKWSRNRAKNNR